MFETATTRYPDIAQHIADSDEEAWLRIRNDDRLTTVPKEAIDRATLSGGLAINEQTQSYRDLVPADHDRRVRAAFQYGVVDLVHPLRTEEYNVDVHIQGERVARRDNESLFDVAVTKKSADRVTR